MFSIHIILEICAGISIIGGACVYAGTFLKALTEPLKDIQDKLDHHDECLARDKRRIDELEEQIRGGEKSTNLLLKSMMTILAHLETNNNTNEIKHMRKTIENYLIDR